MIPRPFRAVGIAVLLTVAASTNTDAQILPPPGNAIPQNPVCSRLEGQLAALDRSTADPARAEQAKRYEEALQSQQTEHDRTVAQARQMGCEGSGFFLFARQPPQCDALNNRIQRMRANLDRLNADLQQIQAPRGPAEGQRRSILVALAQNNCGPQYRAAAVATQPRGFFDALFGGGGSPTGPFGSGDITPSDQSSTFRTICVRTCDGYYFPVSYTTSAVRFRDDEQACQRMCPASEVMLFTYRNPGEDISHAVSIGGQPYNSLPNAFRYRQEFNASCSCRRPGESWADALKHLDDTTVERGDIVVTDETAKLMLQPKPEAPARPTKQAPRAAKTQTPANPADAGTAAPTPAASAPAPVTSAPLPDAVQPAPPEAPRASADPAKRTIRSVGPTFLPAR